MLKSGNTRGKTGSSYGLTSNLRGPFFWKKAEKLKAVKAQALALYARQAKDDELLNHAKRIQVRAVRRCGELLRLIKPAKGGQPFHESTMVTAGPSRKQAAKDAKLSERQQKTAMVVVRLDSKEFEKWVDSNKPQTYVSH